MIYAKAFRTVPGTELVLSKCEPDCARGLRTGRELSLLLSSCLVQLHGCSPSLQSEGNPFSEPGVPGVLTAGAGGGSGTDSALLWPSTPEEAGIRNVLVDCVLKDD